MSPQVTGERRVEPESDLQTTRPVDAESIAKTVTQLRDQAARRGTFSPTKISFLGEDVEPGDETEPPPLPSSGDVLNRLLESVKPDRQASRHDFILEIINTEDLSVIDTKLVGQFTNQGIPRSITNLAHCLQGVRWYTGALSKFTDKLKTQSGRELRETITDFMKDVNSGLRCSSLTTLNLTTLALAQFRGKENKDKPGHMVSTRAVKFWKIWTWMTNVELDEDAKGFISGGKDPGVDAPVGTPFSESPGALRLSHSNPEWSINAAVASLGLIRFVAPITVLSAKNPASLRDEFLILERKNHPMIMKKNARADEWLALEEDSKQPRNSRAAQSRHRNRDSRPLMTRGQ